MAIYRSTPTRFREYLIRLVYDNQSMAFHAIVYNLKGMRVFTTEEYMVEEFANKKAIRWVYENDI